MSFRITYRAAPCGSEAPWVDVARAETPEDARDELESWQGPRLNHGDLVRVDDETRSLVSVFDAETSRLVAAPAIETHEVFGLYNDTAGDDREAWVHFWEGREAHSYWMVMAALSVDRRRIIMLACECAEVAIHLLPARVRRAADRAIGVARDVALGERDGEDARVAAYSLIDASHRMDRSPRHNDSTDDAGRAVALAAVCAAYTAYVDDLSGPATYADYVARYGSDAIPHVSVSGYRGPDATSVRRTAKVVRYWIPLSVVLCARLGLRDPLPLPRVRRPRWRAR